VDAGVITPDATVGSLSAASPAPRAARRAVALMFFVNGALLANWVARIPAVQQRLGLSTGALGIALLGMAVGALAAFPVTGWLIAHIVVLGVAIAVLARNVGSPAQ